MNGTSFDSVKQAFLRTMLASEGVVGGEPGVAPRKKAEVNDVNDAVVEDGGELVNDEFSTVRAQALVVQIYRHFIR